MITDNQKKEIYEIVMQLGLFSDSICESFETSYLFKTNFASKENYNISNIIEFFNIPAINASDFKLNELLLIPNIKGKEMQRALKLVNKNKNINIKVDSDLKFIDNSSKKILTTYVSINSNDLILTVEYEDQTGKNITFMSNNLTAQEVINDLRELNIKLNESVDMYKKLSLIKSFALDEDEIKDFVKKFQKYEEVFYLFIPACVKESQLMLLKEMKNNDIEISLKKMDSLITKLKNSLSIKHKKQNEKAVQGIEALIKDFKDNAESFTVFNRFILNESLKKDLNTNLVTKERVKI